MRARILGLTMLFAAAGCATAEAQAQDGPPPRPVYPGEAPGTTCPRAELTAMVDAYSAALAAHDPSGLELASDVRFTENAEVLTPGESTFWQGAGAWGEQNYLIDTERCGAVTWGVVEENGRLIHAGVRLQTNAAGEISEIEHILGREEEFAFGPETILGTSYLDWETILHPDQRSSRAAMTAAAIDYFDMFSEQPFVNTPFADRCDRWENGALTTPSHNCSPKGLVIDQPPRRVPLVDREAGLVAAFVHFTRSLPDVHVFKMTDGQVNYAQAIVGPRTETVGWPVEE